MDVALFDFDLPDHCIALRPAVPRDAAKMLVINPGAHPEQIDATVTNLPSFLKTGDALVFNDTKVIPAHFKGTRKRGQHIAPISFTLHKKLDGQRWIAFAKPARRLAKGDEIHINLHKLNDNNQDIAIRAIVEERMDAEITLHFDYHQDKLEPLLWQAGHMPLPPYIASKRVEDAQDKIDYQTIYARNQGAVAAPTAGLHFTQALMDTLDHAGITRHYLTLHVGAGTFLPVTVDDTRHHHMHAETGILNADSAEILNTIKANGGRIIAVGTTSLRLLESASDENGILQPYHGDTDIFITPGYRFKNVDGLITNFHLPKSTLFMLVSAFSGRERMLSAYQHAIQTGYRFYSYGDTSLLFAET